MRLKRLYLSKYKNLNDFALNFTGSSFIDVFVGKNGTGKSNMFEALIEIFRQLYEKDFQVGFDFELEYEIDGSDHFVGWEWIAERYYKTEDGERKDIKKVAKEDLPDNVILYYSGHNEKVARLIYAYEEGFKRDLKEANEGDIREFIGIGKDYKALLLSVLLLQPEGCKAKAFIKEKLGIVSIGNEVFISLKRPYYARKKGYEVDRFDQATSFWKAKGITKKFLDQIDGVKRAEQAKERDEGYKPPKDETSYDDVYQLYLDLEAFQQAFADTNSQELFSQLDNLRTIEMLDDISLNLTLTDGTKSEVDHFSDGQFQSIYIYTIVELFRGKNCLTLLDEPDSFLHPEWQFDFLTQVFEIADDATVDNHVLMSSHSAVTLIPHDSRDVNLFNFVGDGVRCINVPKSYAIEQLSAQMIKYSEDEQIISIINQITIEDKPILFTEGSTDPRILKIAWSKLYSDPIPFHIVFAFGCTYLRLLLIDQQILKELNGQPAFGLFDFDMAYDQWNSLATEEIIENDPYKGLVKKIKAKNSYALLLPVPEIPAIEGQVIKNKSEKTTYLGESKLAIEHLFYGDPQTHEFFEILSKPGGGQIISFREKRKTDFSKIIVPKIDAAHFEFFRPMFEFIKSKI
ncbi:AAA family ATPase [Neolewinella aurantiaca]|uniref:AAA family ATPase n=1 Tax=Neolewinella aurantiaca TaxID=2602767 RepID=A0A5C7FVF3_9BACT|nr:AAA family ATPase [Neolewinella aurantiaca]TXF90292.1 AAA family ATPase [Neolewinella aurantiaca]